MRQMLMMALILLCACPPHESDECGECHRECDYGPADCERCESQVCGDGGEEMIDA